MRQPEVMTGAISGLPAPRGGGARGGGSRAAGAGGSRSRAAGAAGGSGSPAAGASRDWQLGEAERRLPPGQYVQAALPVLHYGPVPGCDALAWDLRVTGATASGAEHRFDLGEFRSLPTCEVVADFHCVTKFTVLGITWSGVAAAGIRTAAPPAAAATHVMIWADFGYGANLPLDVFSAPGTVLATAMDGRELTPAHGYPVRLVVPSRYGWKSVKWVRAIEYMVGDRRGFWEERGYHNGADPWREQRYSYQEQPHEGPAL